MRLGRRCALCALLALAILLVPAGCGGRKPAVDTAPFETAVNTYLRTQAMDMKAGRFRSLEVDGDTAKATVSLAHAEGAAGVSVQWRFTFARKGGEWAVSECVRR
jgi:hypothetical protein